MPYTYEWPRPGLTVDNILISHDNQLLLIKRMNDPWKGAWALPGGFIDENEPLEVAAVRELKEETGVDVAAIPGIRPLQVGIWGDPHRDPRGWIVGLAYTYAHCPAASSFTSHGVKAGDDALEAAWFPINDLPPLPCNEHEEMVQKALDLLSRHGSGDGCRKANLPVQAGDDVDVDR